MASSSSHKMRLSLAEQVRTIEEDQEEEEEEEERRDWLQLGLGLGFNSSGQKKQEHYQSKRNPVSVSPASLPSPFSKLHSMHHHKEIELGLGLELELGLGFDNSGISCKNVAPICNNNHNKKLREDLDEVGQYYDDEDHDLDYDDDISSGNFLDWQYPKFNDSHHNSTTRRPHPGLWFTLISFTNRVGQVLPQIPKAYIRVKDENMTVYMVKKYLVRKLGLSNEDEIDMVCMGQNLLPTQTLKLVREAVWLPGLMQSINNSTTLVFTGPQGKPINHLMQLHYGRRCLL